jgi:acyl-CoA synthetase (AMP-forming)/AMP-acid ligase II
MGLVGGILQPLYAGAPMVLMSPMAFLQKPFRWLQAISNYKATISGAPDFAYDLVCRRITSEQQATLDLSCWEVAFIGAEPIRVKTLSRFAATFMPFGFRQEALYPCYGLAENTLIASGKSEATPPKACSLDETSLQRNRVAIVPEQKDAKVIVSCGQNCLDQTIKIVNPESRTVCPPNQIGEVWISGPSTAQGYWNQPVQTEVTFRAFLADTGEGPFLRTGDLGFLHNGELLITGRLKDLVIILGRNYYPQEIELTVEHSHSMLRSGCGVAFSVEITDQEKLIIAHEVEWSYLRKLNANEVFSSIRRAVVEKHDLPVYAIFLLKPASLPKTSSGKVRRIACREGFLTGSLNVVADWSANPRLKAKFLDLETDVSCLLQQLQAEKQCKIDRHLVTGFKVYAD